MMEYISPNDEKLFGATDSETIQNAIAAAEADGCRKIVIPRYNARTEKNEWRIAVSIKVPSDFTIILDNFCSGVRFITNHFSSCLFFKVL